jgi:hypothetical protein
MEEGRIKMFTSGTSRVNKEASPRIQLEEIADQLGTTVVDLLAIYGDAQIVLEKFEAGELKLLTEQN